MAKTAVAQAIAKAGQLATGGLGRNITTGQLGAAAAGVGGSAYLLSGGGSQDLEGMTPTERAAAEASKIPSLSPMPLLEEIGKTMAFGQGGLPQGQVFEGGGISDALVGFGTSAAGSAGIVAATGTIAYQFMNPNSITNMARQSVAGAEPFGMPQSQELQNARYQADLARTELERLQNTTKEAYGEAARKRARAQNEPRVGAKERDQLVRKRGQQAVNQAREADRQRHRKSRPVPYRRDYEIEQNKTLSGARGADTLNQAGDQAQRSRLEAIRHEAEEAERERQRQRRSRNNQTRGGLAGIEGRRQYDRDIAATTQRVDDVESEIERIKKNTRDGGGKLTTKGLFQKWGNRAFRGSAGMVAPAIGFAVGTMVSQTITTGINTAADRIAAIGTPGERAARSNALAARKVTRRGSAVGDEVSSYAGNTRNLMTGETVLALHKTGGSGAVLR